MLERKSWDQEDARKVRFKEWIQRVQVLIALTVPFIGSGSLVSSWSLGILSDAFDMSPDKDQEEAKRSGPEHSLM